jgi:hypothetical protein
MKRERCTQYKIQKLQQRSNGVSVARTAIKRRWSARQNCALDLREKPAEGKSGAAQTLDIGLKGMRVKITKPLKSDTFLVHLDFSLRVDAEKPRLLRAVVVHHTGDLWFNFSGL